MMILFSVSSYTILMSFALSTLLYSSAARALRKRNSMLAGFLFYENLSLFASKLASHPIALLFITYTENTTLCIFHNFCFACLLVVDRRLFSCPRP